MRHEHLFAVLICSVVALGCNDTPLAPLGNTLSVTTNDLSPEIGSNQVDILWMIDSSGSMNDEQAELAKGFSEFVSALAEIGADFRIGVVTSDMVNRAHRGALQSQLGCVGDPGNAEPVDPALIEICAQMDLQRPYLEYTSYVGAGGALDLERLERDFRCIATVGTCGSGLEAGIQTVLQALSPEMLSTVNAGFLRDDAYLAVMFLTDEEDCSFGGSFTPASNDDCYIRETRDQMIDPRDAFDQLVAHKGGDASRVLIAGIIAPPSPRELPTRPQIIANQSWPVSCNYQRDGGEEQTGRDGSRYRDMLTLAGPRGVEESICAADFRNALQKIGQVLRDSLDVNCLQRAPATCRTDADCNAGVACLNPGDPAVGSKYCADFQMVIEVNSAQQPGAFTPLAGPGPVGQTEPSLGARFLVDYDAVGCARGVSFSFEDGARPAQGTRYRASYPLRIDTVTTAPSERDPLLAP